MHQLEYSLVYIFQNKDFDTLSMDFDTLSMDFDTLSMDFDILSMDYIFQCSKQLRTN